MAATARYEAYPSIAYDASGRLWVAYEEGGAGWGKDFGAYDTTGIGLYQNHTIAVRCLVGGDLYSTVDDINNTLPGAPGSQIPATETRLHADPAYMIAK